MGENNWSSVHQNFTVDLLQNNTTLSSVDAELKQDDPTVQASTYILYKMGEFRFVVNCLIWDL